MSKRPILIQISKGNNLLLDRTTPHVDECKRLIAEMIKQAVRDFINFEDTCSATELEIRNEATDFLFDDNYWVKWGGHERTLRDFLDILDIDLVWFRETVLKKHEQKREEDVKNISINSGRNK